MKSDASRSMHFCASALKHVETVRPQVAAGSSSISAPRAQNTLDLANLDLLRALAVGLVFIGHLLGTMKIRGFGELGHFGVLLFFVHTSLVLMLSMQRLGLSGRKLYVAFMVRRVFRIYPLSIAAVLCAIAFQIPSTSWLGGYVWRGWLTVLSNLFLVQNITHSGSVNCVLWSLPFEVQMYAVLPVLFIILRRYPSIGAAWGAWAAGVVLATAEYLIRGGGPAEGDLLLRYFPCFIAGILAWWLLERRQGTLSGGYWILTLVLLVFAYRLADSIRVYGPALALALHGTLRNDHQIWWPPGMELVNDWGFCCLTGLAIPLFADIRSKWLNATTKSIARYSYGIYVCHVPILWLIFVKLHIASLEIGALLSLILTLLMSVALYNFLENPTIRLGKRLASQLTYSGITA